MNSEISTNQIAFNLLQKARNKFEAKKYVTALQYCEAALAIYKEISDTTGVAYTLTNIGNIYRRQAEESYQEALLTFREHSIQISEEIAESINSTLETQLHWYASNNGNTESLKPTDFGTYLGEGQPLRGGDGMGDGQPSSSDRPVTTNGEGQP